MGNVRSRPSLITLALAVLAAPVLASCTAGPGSSVAHHAASSRTSPVTAATYHSCSDVAGFFAQGFTFTDGKIRGCVPLDVTIGQDTQVHHVTLSLFAGRCTS
jgi:hypothetical protein